MCSCTFLLVILHANRVLSVAYYVVLRGPCEATLFSELPHKRAIFGKKLIEHEILCFLYNVRLRTHI
jgi:hypothetical protein